MTLASALAGLLVWAGPSMAQGYGNDQQSQTRQSGKTQTSAQQTQTDSSRQAQMGQGSQGQQGGQLSDDLKKSLQKLHAANQAEIELGNTAQQQAQSQDVKQFAKTMVDEHKKSDEKLQQSAQQWGVQLRGEEFNNAIKESREKQKELRGKQGAEFDRAYMEFMVKDHQEDVKEVHDAAMKASENGRQQLAQMLGETEATLHQHHAKARQVNQKLQRQGRADTGQSQSGGMLTDRSAGTGEAQQTGQSQPADQQAQRGETQQSGSMAAASQTQQSGDQASKSVVGTIESVEGDKLSMKNQIGETNEFAIDDSTRFTREGKTISKDQISEGDQVRAAFTGDEGNFQATEIMVMSSGQQSGQAGQQSGQKEQSQGEKQRESTTPSGQETQRQ